MGLKCFLSEEGALLMRSQIFNESKFRELVLYIASRCEGDPTFGMIKLNKELFFADFWAYAKYEKPITGAEYIKLQFGPAPRLMSPIREEMEKDGDIVIVHREQFVGYPQKRVVARREPDLSEFTGNEIALVNEVIGEFASDNAAELSDLSHQFPGWQMASDKEIIPYEAIFISNAPVTTEDERWARELASQHGW